MLQAVSLTVRQIAEYLQLNVKIYTLATEEKIPTTKLTGKWMFQCELIEHKMLESTHGGVFLDRLAVAGSEDQLLFGALALISNTMQSHALLSCTRTGLGLELFVRTKRVDASCLHWEPLDESPQRHPASLQNQAKH